MITVLVVSPEGVELQGLEDENPSIEVLRARDLEETLEKLARNRRIDAVLILSAAEAPRISEAVLAENPAAPPLFAPAGSGVALRVKTLSSASPTELLRLIDQELEGFPGP